MHIPFALSQAEFAVLSPRVAQKGNSNVLAHFSSIRVFTVPWPRIRAPAPAGKAITIQQYKPPWRSNPLQTLSPGGNGSFFGPYPWPHGQ